MTFRQSRVHTGLLAKSEFLLEQQIIAVFNGKVCEVFMLSLKHMEQVLKFLPIYSLSNSKVSSPE